MMKSDTVGQLQAREWSQLIGYSMPVLGANITDTNAVAKHPLSASAGLINATLAPSAFSAQVMNPNALQTTSGILYGGRFHTVPEFDFGSSITGEEFASNFVSYNSPRLMSAGKLALRGVSIDAIPFNMSKLSDFCRLSTDASGATTLSNDSPFFDGFAPLVVYNPSGVTIEYLVCVEWRCRFDATNPAQAGHVMHRPSTDNQWHAAIDHAMKIGNGVKDIAESVAAVGSIVRNAFVDSPHFVDLTKRPTFFKSVTLDLSASGVNLRQQIFHLSPSRKYHVFAKEQIDAEMEGMFHLSQFKSKKWTHERFENTFNQLLRQVDPKYRTKAKIKLEPMGTKPDGSAKPPRLLIADGDHGQIMSLLTISIFERLLFKKFHNRSIKGRSRRKALQDVVSYLRPPKKYVGSTLRGPVAPMVEGDGSAWDSCCSKRLRDLVENPVLKHIATHLLEYFVVPPQWEKEHANMNTSDRYFLEFKEKLITYFVQLKGIRRSGDDSLARICRALGSREEDPRTEYFLSFWRRLGVDMKIRRCGLQPDNKPYSEFIGTHFLLDEQLDLEGTFVPDLVRNLSNNSSTTPGTLQAFEQGKFHTIRQTSAAAALSSALDYAGILPLLSMKYLQYANQCYASDFHNDDLSFLASGEVGTSSHSVIQIINRLNCEVDIVKPDQKSAEDHTHS
ncbi:unnamed protein product, partial [Symbiodinium necroappetens]